MAKNIAIKFGIAILSVLILLLISSFIFKVSGKPVDAKLDESLRTSRYDVIQLNVLNGCGEEGIAGKTMDYLRALGFDVVEIGNYENNIEESIVIDRLGDPLSSRKVAYALGISDSLVVSKIDSNLYLRSTVVIGKDFNTLKPFNY
jgi:hypothetical protein